ncbi:MULTISPECIES: hypothetical protein [unclassified Clostridium]|uniref:hypothetical protein n=1 Tax=unclassified Clostridium TaxID=2614128 RepID=UPI0013FC9E50|nr:MULTISPECIES: hypothetical protein [unclassified Clostridium]NFR85939.1 hypothetical protein [Clostridium botulinum]NFR91337.1 hypothetical protein [Clostridium botulinum]NFT98594.1 hypothetical protein [Clostridium botulinum]
MKKLMLCLLFFTMFLTACSSNDSKSTNNLVDDNSNKSATQNSNDTNESENTQKNSASTNDSKNTSQNFKDTHKKKENPKNSKATSNEKTAPLNNNSENENIKEKVMNYIINGQENKPEAEKIKWSKTFLNQVDIENLYKQYIKNGGETNNLEKFADYITLNAPIPNDWEKLFEKDLYDTYGEKVVRLEHLQDDLYQAYIKKDGVEVPYVVVSSRTGYFHG